MSEIVKLSELDDGTLRDMADVEEDVNKKGKYFLELAHRVMPLGEEAQADYEVWLKKAIECGNEEARGEYENYCQRKENSKENKDAAIRKRIQEIRAMTQVQTSELVQKEEMAAIYVLCERVVSRKLVTSGDLDNIAGKLQKMSYQMSRNPENVVPLDLMGDLYFKIGSMYEQKGNVEKAIKNYGNATEYGNLDAMRVLRSGKLGNENREKYAENAATIGNAEDKFISLITALKSRKYEEADVKIVEMLKTDGKTMNDLYKWAGEVLKYDYTDGAITIYEYIMDSAEEGTSCLKLASWMYNALNGTEPDELWEIMHAFGEEEKDSLKEAVSLYLNFSMKQCDNENNGIRALPKKITPDGIDIWIYNSQIKNGIPDGNCEIKSFKELTLREITPDRVTDTYGSNDFVWRAEVEMSNGEIRNVYDMWDNKGKKEDPVLADCILRHNLQYTDDCGSFIMILDVPEKVLKCTITGLRNEGEDTIAEKCIVYEGSIKDELEHGVGSKYIYSNINTSFLSPVLLIKGRPEIPFDEKYEGDFKFGKYWGFGKRELEDGRIWEGTFVDGKCDGIVHWQDDSAKRSGIFTFKNGRRIEGCAIKINEINPDGSMQGYLYKGQYSNGILKGICLRFKNLPEEMANIEYASEHFNEIPFYWKEEGQFNNKYQLDGEGEETEVAADTGEWNRHWKGTYRDGCLQGYGQWEYKKGDFVKGQWEKGKFIQGIRLNQDQQGEWDLLSGNYVTINRISLLDGKGECYHFATLPDEVYSNDIETRNLDELPYTWMFSGEFIKGHINGYGKLAFKEDKGEIRYEGKLLRTENGRFVAIAENHSWKEMDASFHEMSGKGCRVDITSLCEDEETADGYYYVGKMVDGVPEGEGISGRFVYRVLNEITYDAFAGKNPEQLEFEELYEGQFINGEATGHGKLTDDNGNTWEGDFSRRLPNGQCFHKYSSGDDDYIYQEYTGQYVDGVRDGFGCLVDVQENPDDSGNYFGYAYVGKFEKGEIKGAGRLKEFSELRGDHAHAEYILDHFDEESCKKLMEGTFNASHELDGTGRIVVLDKSLIWEQTGTFNRNQLNGEGKCCLYSDPSIQEGDQRLDNINDRLQVWCYKGSLREGKPCDSGILSVPASSEWYKPLNASLRKPVDNNQPIALRIEGFSGELGIKCGISKLEKMLLPNGDNYSGEVDSFLRPHGYGRMHYADYEDLCYIGSFSEGIRHGTGRLLHGRKTVYEGEWRNNHIIDKIHFSQKKYKDFL